jgi:ComF family protein
MPLVHQFKFQQTPGLARWLAAQLLAQAHVCHALREVDSITAIPLSSAGLARRGYNQAWELAKAVSRAAKRPSNAHLLARLRDGPEQVGRKLSERRRNIKDAFACTQDVRGLHIAVVDDVMTSGATLKEAAATLKRAGAARVTNLVLLRTEL